MNSRSEPSPMFRQYSDHKKNYPDAVLFFRLGDFYEMFESDALEVSRLLNLTLTHRQGIPMCGIPHHVAEDYIGRLLKLGKKIALCDQVGPLPPKGKGIVRREVVEVVSPGMIINENYLSEGKNNYLAALGGVADQLSYAYIDLSTAEFCVASLSHAKVTDFLRLELMRTAPQELIIQESLLGSGKLDFLHAESVILNRVPDWAFDKKLARDLLNQQFATHNLKAFGLEDDDARLPAAGAILDYLRSKKYALLPHIQSIKIDEEDRVLGLDATSIRSLELVHNLQNGGSKFTLLEILNHSKTAPGARYLRRRLLHPFLDARLASAYHDRVEALYDDQLTLNTLRQYLSGFLDLERLATRVAMDKAHAKNFLAIRDSLDRVKKIYHLLQESILGQEFKKSQEIFQTLEKLRLYLSAVFLDNPSTLLTEGRLIRDGWDKEVDRMRHLYQDGKAFLDAYLSEEKAATGINGLKLKFNRVLGYFLEVGNAHVGRIPERYRRRQTLAAVERFSTKRLEDLEIEYNNASENLIKREQSIFFEVREKVKNDLAHLYKIAALIAEVDLTQAFAHAATEYGYRRPVMGEKSSTQIKAGRHPVVERYLPQGVFVPNDFALSTSGVSFALVTGPNMAGKSTLLRQIALITLMAQAGSFVPADSAEIGVADKIYCRVGASDNLARGESTFLMEMNETSYILRNATSQSLIIMDEVGRGTSTEDGLAIAGAVCEYLLDQVGARSLFATHYRELTRFDHPRLRNFSMAVKEAGDKIIFPKLLLDGPTLASYGIHVAALAGLPSIVVQRARDLLQTGYHEKIKIANPEKQEKKIFLKESPPIQKNLFDPTQMILDKLQALDPNTISPLEALNILADWHKELKKIED